MEGEREMERERKRERKEEGVMYQYSE